MTIEEFVKEAITGIVKGVAGASEELKGTGAVVNPMTVNGNDYSEGWSETQLSRKTQDVEISIALTTENSQGKSGSFGLSVAGMSATLPGKEKSEIAGSINYIKFTIPVGFPIGVLEELK